MVCVDPNDIPMCAVIDCELMYSMPKGLTAATGMDALTHAVEGYLTPGAWTMSDMFELKAIELIARHLKNAVDAVKALSLSIRIPQRLHELGVREEDIPALAVAAFNDVCTGGNPRPTSVEEIERLYHIAY